MKTHRLLTLPYKRFLVPSISVLLLSMMATASGVAAAGPDRSPTAAEGGQEDFHWEIGTWATTVKVLADPLSPTPDEWLQFSGTSVVKPLMDRRANVLEFEVSGPNGRIEALSLRLFEPKAERWSITFVNIRNGLLTPAVYGGFRDGVGTFYGDDELDGRPIKVRFLIIRQGPDKARFEQAFSDDGGTTWETNWMAVDRRIDP